MTSIATLTMNPAVDVSAEVELIEPVRKLRCQHEHRDPGGGGVNVARVVHRLGGKVVAVYPAGGPAGDVLKRLVEGDGVESRVITIAGDTREDFNVTERASGQQYRFVLPGPSLSGWECRSCLEAFAVLADEAGLICASGSLPPGAPTDFYAQVARMAAERGARLALDTSGHALKAALGPGVFLIKPSIGELRDLVDAPLEDLDAMIGACQGLVDRGAARIVALTLGAEGALLVTAGQVLRAPPLPVKPVSTVGAGDSFLGAMIFALSLGHDLEEAFRHGVAGGSAALLAEGSDLCRREDVLGFLPDVAIGAVRPTAAAP
ncbi:1-phosphofructokinase family hexose kinase [Phenylobacterium montanum]|uniref:Phosphofructokinase n=1 Tax=Phenylobacterium montanum TaxID=2823693 RepID=A0A975ITI3_9CAUL|nr:1-phosphofructokinase family hexose kinase [Caulobacter sp. S6]QUD86897.1 1-phosphofructokinase family hexose kinase [Caulobacter sp. S6]